MNKLKISKYEEILIKFLDEYEFDIFTFSELKEQKGLNIDFIQPVLGISVYPCH